MKIVRYVSNEMVKAYRHVYEAEQDEIDKINTDNEKLSRNLFIDTADSDGLIPKEKKYGITVDITDTLENRRARIKAKKRSTNTFNIETIKNMAKAFSNGDVDFIQHYEEDYFIIKFVGTVGIPPKIQDLYDAIEEIKPCHLDVEYEFTYNTEGDIEDSNWTEEELEQFTEDEIRTSNNIKTHTNKGE